MESRDMRVSRRVARRTAAVAASGALLTGFALTATPALAAPGQPDFNDHVYADGQAYGTKFTTALKGPRGNNSHSFDALYVVTNGADGQLPVAEAAPGERDYNGGRWAVQTASWTITEMPGGLPLPVLRSDDELLAHAGVGHITVTAGAPSGGPPDYFQCPLLPVK